MRNFLFLRRGSLSRRIVTVFVALSALFLIGSLVLFHLRLSRIEDAIEAVSNDESAAAVSSSGEGSSTHGDLFERAVGGVEELLDTRNADASEALFEQLLDPRNPGSILAASPKLRRRNDGELRASLWSGDRRYFAVHANTTRGEVEIESRFDDRITVSETGRDGEAGLREFILQQEERLDEIFQTEERMRSELEALPHRDSITAALETHGLGSTRIVRDGFVLRRGFATDNGAVITRVAADAKNTNYSVDGEVIEGGVADFVAATAEALRSYDPESELRRVDRDLKAIADSLLSDQGFVSYLEGRSLEMRESNSSRSEDAERDGRRREYYRLVDARDGALVARVVGDVGDGSLDLVGADGELVHTLDRVVVRHGLGSGADTTDDAPGFLLLGLNDNLPDSIMYVLPGANGISVISIPRDIYHDGRKLNEVHALFGPDAMIEQIEVLLGLEINHYVAIEMNAFSEIVDALGHVTVEMEHEFLDPTRHYHIDGERRMLYFAPGEHALNSDAALNLARSRATSSDFDRAARQQAILAGIRERVDQLALSDADTLFNLIRLGLEHTATDIGFLEALQYYRRYRDVADMRRLVMSTDNAFYSTYTALHEQGLDPESVDEYSGDPGGWILRPRGDAWENVRAFLRDWLAGGDPAAEDYFESPGEEGGERINLEAVEALGL